MVYHIENDSQYQLQDVIKIKPVAWNKEPKFAIYQEVQALKSDAPFTKKERT